MQTSKDHKHVDTKHASKTMQSHKQYHMNTTKYVNNMQITSRIKGNHDHPLRKYFH